MFVSTSPQPKRWSASTNLESYACATSPIFTTTTYLLKQQRNNHVAKSSQILRDTQTNIRQIPALLTQTRIDRAVQCGVKRTRKMIGDHCDWLCRYQGHPREIPEEAQTAYGSQDWLLYNKINRVANPFFTNDQATNCARPHFSTRFTALVKKSSWEESTSMHTLKASQDLQALQRLVNRAFHDRPMWIAFAVYEIQLIATSSEPQNLKPIAQLHRAFYTCAGRNPYRHQITKPQFMQIATTVGGIQSITATHLFTCLDPYDTKQISFMQAVVPIFLTYRPDLFELEVLLTCTNEGLCVNQFRQLHKMYSAVRNGMLVEDIQEILQCCIIEPEQAEIIEKVMNQLHIALGLRNKILHNVPGYQPPLINEDQFVDLLQDTPGVLNIIFDLIQKFMDAVYLHVKARRQRDKL